MIKKLITIFFITFSAALSSFELPNQFFVNQHWFSLTNCFTIKTEQESLGTVYRKLLSLNLQYELNDTEENLVATAYSRYFSLGTIFDIVDAEGVYLGRIDEYLFTFFPKFDILGPDEKILATAKLNIWGTTYTFEADDRIIATMNRRFFSLKDDWVVTIYDPSAFGPDKIDPKLMIILAAFQTDCDYWSQQNQGGNNSE